ncbi:hypothetical protein KF840_06115 [bacterium]|nr:hypothetical protein [bacterium]
MGWVGEGSFAGAFGLRPGLFADYQEFEQAVRGAVDPRLFALCQARVGYLLGARETALEPESDRERACLRLADKFVLDPHGVTDADAAAVVAHLGPPATVALVEALALLDGFTRFRLILGVED